jgi:phage/conjugal plasmid C-4 type zinc finger TraR family protein
MDDFDRAQDLEMAERNALISKQRQKLKTVSLSHCEDCGGEIPEKRRAVKGVTRCISCQQDHEKLGKQYG